MLDFARVSRLEITDAVQWSWTPEAVQRGKTGTGISRLLLEELGKPASQKQQVHQKRSDEMNPRRQLKAKNCLHQRETVTFSKPCIWPKHFPAQDWSHLTWKHFWRIKLTAQMRELGWLLSVSCPGTTLGPGSLKLPRTSSFHHTSAPYLIQ